MRPVAFLWSVAAVLGLAAGAQAADWYQWRGPEQDGVSREKNLPDHWSPEGDNVAWQNNCGGMSSPIVMNGKVYTFTRVGEVPAGEGLTATLDPGPKTQEAMTCLDAKSGATLWQHKENMTMTDVPFHRLGWSNPVGDPATGRVYALGAQCMFYCFDGSSGAVVWKRQMTEEFGMISTFGGRTPSPAIDEDQVLIAGVSFGWGNHAGAQHRIFAFDKATGRLNWSAGTGGIPVDAPYNTPVVGVIHGERLVVFAAGDGGIHAFQVRTGKKAWSFKGSKHGMNSSVIIHGDHVYASWDLDNYDSTKLGRVVCLDGANVTNGSPKEVWRQDGIEAGFPSPTLYDGTLYVATDNAQLYAIDEKTGKIKYRHGFGTMGKASLVYADGKLYYPESNGRMWILKPGEKKFEVLSHVDLEEKAGREYVIFGSVAISDGRVYLQAATKMYCIGPKEIVPQAVTLPEVPKEEPIGKDEHPKAALLQVVPADALMSPGQKTQFTCREFDAKGRLIGEVKPQWSVGQLIVPPPRARPKELMRLNSMSAEAPARPMPNAPPVKPVTTPAAGGSGSPGGSGTSGTVAGAPPTPAAQPTKIGNLQGQVDPTGTFLAEAGPAQGGAVIATADGLTGEARVRVLSPLPWTVDFQKTPPGKPPLTWIGAGMKFAARDLDGRRVLVKLTDIPLYARARTYLGPPDMSDYTIQADVKVVETAFDDSGTIVHQMPDVGVIDSRYVMELKGSKQTLGLHSWPAALPRDELDPGLVTHKTIPFEWKAGQWYREKLFVQVQGDKAVVKGKVWKVGEEEPGDWTIEIEDPTPNLCGAPGLWGFSNGHEIYYDNILVTKNKP